MHERLRRPLRRTIKLPPKLATSLRKFREIVERSADVERLREQVRTLEASDRLMQAGTSKNPKETER
jgi:hypothetical protein